MTEETITNQVYKLLDKNPLLKPKQICRILQIPYKPYSNYITKLRCQWKKHYLKKREGLKRLSFHRWHGWVYVPKSLRDGFDVGLAVDAGWWGTRAKNGMLVWKSGKGRLEWFPSTGRVKVWIKSPASKGKAAQLLADGFFATGLIFDIRVFKEFLRGLRFKGASCVIEVGERLPYVQIDLLKKNNGVTITLGDRSHPSGIELDFSYPDWAEHNERLLARLTELMEKNLVGKVKHPEPEEPYWR